MWNPAREAAGLGDVHPRDCERASPGDTCLVIDGTLIPIGRVAAGRPFCSGKHRKRGMNLQVIASPDGDIRWVSWPPAPCMT